MARVTSPPRPEPFGAYTTPEFWDDPHISERMLRAHLDPGRDAASRTHAFIDRSAAWLRAEFGLVPGSRVLDLGCGPGLYAVRLARAGVEVLGVDVSRRSLEYARAAADRASLPVRLLRGTYLEADLGAGHDAVRPGGSFLFDVTAAARFASARESRREEVDLMGGFWAPRPYRGVHETWTYPGLRLILDRYAIHSGGTVRTFWNWTHCLTPAQVGEELARAGLAVVTVHGDVAGGTYDESAAVFAVHAVRP